MKYFVLTFVIGAVVLAGCSNKDTKEPVNGAYPHLLKFEKELVDELDKLAQEDDGREGKEKVKIIEKLFDTIASDTATLSHEFGPLQEAEGFQIVTSPDKNLRIYVTKCNTSEGTAKNLVQYRDNDGIIHVINAQQWKKQIENKSGNPYELLFEDWIHKILEFTCKDSSKLYVVISDKNLNGEMSNHSITYTLAAYRMNVERLEPVEAFVSENKTAHVIEREYNFSYFWNYPEEQHHDFAEVDSGKQALYVGNEEDNVPVDRYQCFLFDGTRLTDMGEKAPFWLHNSLHKYKRIVYLCHTRSHYIRIDDMGQGVYRYASWKRNAMFADKPSLVAYGKKRLDKGEDGLADHILSFFNDGHEYRIRIAPGRWGFYAAEMEIIKNGKVIQKSDLI